MPAVSGTRVSRIVSVGVLIRRAEIDDWQVCRDIRLRALREEPQAYESTSTKSSTWVISNGATGLSVRRPSSLSITRTWSGWQSPTRTTVTR